MKKIYYLILAILSSLIMAACQTNLTDDYTEILTPDTLTFQAEVLEQDPNYYLRHEDALLFVRSITHVSGHNSGGRYFINRNESVTVLDINGEAMSYLDILPGAIVEITYYGLVLQSDPAIIPAAVLVQVIE